ncbi:hypothetical protein D3C83_40740 [compost metagenome]
MPFEDRHANLLRRSGIDGRLVDDDRAGLEVLADRHARRFERPEVGLPGGVDRRRHGNDDEIGVLERQRIVHHSQMLRHPEFRR